MTKLYLSIDGSQMAVTYEDGILKFTDGEGDDQRTVRVYLDAAARFRLAVALKAEAARETAIRIALTALAAAGLTISDLEARGIGPG